MKIAEMGVRKCDAQGCGYYGASRGNRKHNGIDLCKIDGSSLENGTPITLGFSGRVTKIGWAYSDKPHHYVEVQFGNYYCRVFYVTPCVDVGYIIDKDQIIGESMPLGQYYKDITEHVHIEFFKLKEPSKGHTRPNRAYVDPEPILGVLKCHF